MILDKYIKILETKYYKKNTPNEQNKNIFPRVESYWITQLNV